VDEAIDISFTIDSILSHQSQCAHDGFPHTFV